MHSFVSYYLRSLQSNNHPKKVSNNISRLIKFITFYQSSENCFEEICQK